MTEIGNLTSWPQTTLTSEKGHLGLRTMLRYVTDPNHVDSSAAYAFIPGILRRKAINPRRHRPFRILPRHKGGLVRPPLAVSPLIELELRRKNERVARRETKRLIYKLKVLGQPVTSEVRSSAEKWRKPWSPITSLLMELEQNFNVQRVPCDE